MTNYEIFLRCFPEMKLDERQFTRLSGLEHGKVLECDGGFALIDGNAIRLLCVLPEMRGKGAGASLLKRAEEHVRSQGHSRVELGGTGSQLFIGVPENTAGFFHKRGYSLTDRVAEMYGTPEMLHPAPEAEADFGFFRGAGLNEAVSAVEADWVQYFDRVDVFCGTVDGKIASFCIVDDDVECIFSDGSKIGSVGCVGTVPEFRRRGIGLKMVELAARELYRRGCGKIFIHYTGVYDWYAKIGFRTGYTELLGGRELL